MENKRRIKCIVVTKNQNRELVLRLICTQSEGGEWIEIDTVRKKLLVSEKRGDIRLIDA